jgi:hypothetical protein
MRMVVCVLLYLKRPHSGNISLRSEARETNQISTNNMVDDDGKQAGLFLMNLTNIIAKTQKGLSLKK